MILLLGSLGYLHRPRPVRLAAAPAIRSVVVLPLQNMSQDASQDYVAEGLTEELITDLARLGSLRVISRTSAMQYRGTRKRIPEIGRELNVDAVIEGAFISSNGHVRVTAQMIDARTDTHLWAESYERDAQELLPLEAGLAQDIADQIRVQLTAEQTASLRNRSAVECHRVRRISQRPLLLEQTNRIRLPGSDGPFAVDRVLDFGPSAASHDGRVLRRIHEPPI